jgi:transcriptional regulator with XRE-family HTH domain
MDNEKMGRFISEHRKLCQLTQKELAEQLNVSDKAVSKWERGLSCPDISLLSPLSSILGVTTTELLNGERAGAEAVNVETVVVNALEYGVKAGERNKELNLSLAAAICSVSFLFSIFVVSVVNVAVARAFTWSLIPITAIVFVWIVARPFIRFGLRGILWSLIAFSVFVTPFLYVLDSVIDRLLGADIMLFSIGLRIVPLSVAFIWIAYFLFKKFKTRILLNIAILVLVSSPISYFTNAMIANMLDQSYEQVTVILNTFTPVIVAAILFSIEFVMRTRRPQKS